MLEKLLCRFGIASITVVIATNPAAASIVPSILIVDATALAEANEHLESAAKALNAVSTAKEQSTEKKFFQAAKAAIDAAVDAVDAEAIPKAAEALDDFTDAVEAADAAKTKEEQQDYLDAATAAIEELSAAVNQADAKR